MSRRDDIIATTIEQATEALRELAAAMNYDRTIRGYETLRRMHELYSHRLERAGDLQQRRRQAAAKGTT